MMSKLVSASIYLNRILSVFGLKLSRNKTPKLYNPVKHKCHHPCALQYKDFNHLFLLRVPLSMGRTSRWFNLSEDSLDPPLVSLRAALSHNLDVNELYDYLKKELKIYHKLVTPLNAAASVGLDDASESLLSKHPPWASVLPWEDGSIQDKLHTFPIAVKADRLKSGFKINSNDPIKIMELDKLASLDSHIKQFSKLLTSITRRGMLQGGKYGYISAFILIDNGDWRWILGGEGNHRAIAASALGYNELDVLVEGVVRKEDLKWWPNVCNGLYTKHQAEQIFNDIFNAKPPNVNAPWVDYSNNTV